MTTPMGQCGLYTMTNILPCLGFRFIIGILLIPHVFSTAEKVKLDLNVDNSFRIENPTVHVAATSNVRETRGLGGHVEDELYVSANPYTTTIIRQKNPAAPRPQQTSTLRKVKSVMKGGRDVKERRFQLLSPEEESLRKVLLSLVVGGPWVCGLVFVADEDHRRSELYTSLVELPLPKVVVSSESVFTALSDVNAVQSPCRLHLYLTKSPGFLISLLNHTDEAWDFEAWHIGVGWRAKQFRSFTSSPKLLRTLRAANIVRSSTSSSAWSVQRHCLYAPSDRDHLQLPEQLVADVKSDLNSMDSTKPTHVLNLRGYPLKVVILEWQPSVFFETSDEGQRVPAFGTDVELIKALALALNFSVEYRVPAPGEFWGSLEDGAWTGMVGMLNRTEADIGVGNVFVTLSRYDALLFSAPYDMEVSCFMASEAPPLARWKHLTFPFSGVTWVAVGLGCLALWVSLTLFSNCSRGETRRGAVQNLVVMVGIIFREQVKWIPRRHTSRVVVCVAWLYGLVISVAYSSNLTALLTVTKTPRTYETAQELYEAGLLVTSLGEFFRTALASSVEPHLRKLGDRFVAYDSLQSIWPLVESGRGVYIHNRQFLEYTIATQFTAPSGVSSFRIMKQCFAPYSISLALQKHSPLKSSIDTVVSRLVESGLVRLWFLQSLQHKEAIQVGSKTYKHQTKRTALGDGDLEESTSSIALSLDHLSGAFLIYCILNSVAVVVFCSELFATRGWAIFKTPKCVEKSRSSKGM